MRQSRVVSAVAAHHGDRRAPRMVLYQSLECHSCILEERCNWPARKLGV